MKALKILTFCVFLMVSGIMGCSTGGTSGSGGSEISTYTIVKKYTENYISISNVDTNTDNNDIAAMLQTITVKLIKTPCKSWQDVNKVEDEYIASVKSNYISSVYTIVACSNEIEIVDGFCDEIIYYYSITQSGYYFMAGDLLSESATRFIINMDKYEYEKVKNFR